MRERRLEIEQAALNRVHAIADPIEAADSEYTDGLKLAVSAALDYGLAAIEHGAEHRPPPVPSTLLCQARLAARIGVSLDTVLRRYISGFTLFGDFVLCEAESEDLHGVELKRLLNGPAALFDRLMTTVADEYCHEAEVHRRSPELRRLARVRDLLAGEPVDSSVLGYDMDAWHVGVVATGATAASALRAAASASRALFMVRPSDESVWAWLGARHPIDVADLLDREWSGCTLVALGEPASGIDGWRLTHRQANAALTVAQRSGARVARYADVGLLAAVLRDELLRDSLRHLYLEPLGNETDGGAVLGQTLDAYFRAQRRASSAAAALGVTRQTVAKRLAQAEERLGLAVNDKAIEIELALRLAAAER